MSTTPVSFFDEWDYFVRLLKGRFITIASFFMVTFFVVLVGTSLKPRIYRTAATVLIDMETPKVLAVSTSRDESTVGQSNYMTYADYYRTQLEVIRSRAIAERVLLNLTINERSPYKEAKDPVSTLLTQVKVEPVKQTRLAKIFVEDRDPSLAAKIANEFALVFVEDNLVKTAAAETMTLMKNEYLKLQSKEAELSKRYKAKFPAMVRIRQQMDQLAKAIEEEMKQELHYERYVAEGESAVREISGRNFLERFRKGSMVSGLRPNNIRLQDFSQVPTKPYKPNRKLNFLLALFFGLLGGIAAGVVEELLDGSVKMPEDIERDSRFFLLGQIPRFDGVDQSPPNASPMNHYQYAHLVAHSLAAEAYRALRTNLIYAAPQTHSQVLIITSPGSEEGKTTTLTNLGITLAHMGLKVLLVDADLRKPKVHDVFGVGQEPGLSEYLIGRTSWEKLVHTTDIPNLFMISSGACPPNPTELLSLPQMKEFLKQAATQFDRVLIDTPPVMVVADAVILGAISGTVLAVVQSGRTPRQALHRLASTFQKVQAKVLGVVLNNISGQNYPTYYRYGYSSYYHRDRSNDEKPMGPKIPTWSDRLPPWVTPWIETFVKKLEPSIKNLRSSIKRLDRLRPNRPPSRKEEGVFRKPQRQDVSKR